MAKASAIGEITTSDWWFHQVAEAFAIIGFYAWVMPQSGRQQRVAVITPFFLNTRGIRWCFYKNAVKCMPLGIVIASIDLGMIWFWYFKGVRFQCSGVSPASVRRSLPTIGGLGQFDRKRNYVVLYKRRLWPRVSSLIGEETLIKANFEGRYSIYL